MSLSPPLSSGSMAPTFSSLQTNTALKSESDAASSTTSPPVTPPTRSSGPDAGSAMHTTLPSPPPSSSSHSRSVKQGMLGEDSGSIEKIARRLSPTHHSRPSTSDPNNMARASPRGATGAGVKTHSSSSSTSSVAHSHSHSNNHVPPSSIHNKHVVSLAKTKALGHLARSTSSEVDNEVAHALASGRSIVSKTDWKEDDAQYLVQLIENQFPKGNIIWDWVGQQMVSRGFTKSQCRSKWKRIRTKVLHGDGTQTAKDRDYPREPDELLDDDDDEPMAASEDAARWHARQESGRSHGSQRTQSSRYRSRSPTSRSYPGHPRYDERRNERDVEEENEIWSDDEDPNSGYNGYDQGHYPGYGESPSSARPRQHSQSHYRQSSSNMADENGEDSRLSAIATPNSFGKIEWKPEDSEFLVRLIESKFASRKVDWAWVSKQMEGRGYDRTQCKSRWWRVQHRQNQSNHGGSHGLHASRRQRQESGVSQGQDDKPAFVDSDNEDALQEEQQREHTAAEAQQGRDDPSVGSRASSVSEDPNSTRLRQDQQDTSNSKSEQQPPTEGRSSKGEHQKHIEWKEEDSRYMYRIIEREFPVGNVVWSVIAEKMASRGYSQTQCMSKWRRHLKHNKMSNEGNIKGSGMSMSMDLDADMGSVTSGTGTGVPVEDERSAQQYRQSYRADSGGAKRLKTGPRDSGISRGSEDYGHVGPLDARLVEMEYDRYYDAGGKRRRTEEGESHPDHAHHRRHSHHRHHHHDPYHYDRHTSIPYDDRYPKEHNDGYRHRDPDPASAPYYADYYRDEREPPFDPRYGRHTRYENEARLPQEEAESLETSRPALVDERYEPTTTVASAQGMGEEQEEELPLESQSEPHSSSRRYHNQPIAAGEPQSSWADEPREGGDANPDNREMAMATSPRLSYRGTPSHQAPPPQPLSAHHRQRSSSVASSGYREAYGSTQGQHYGHSPVGHDAPSVRGSRPDHHHHHQRQEGSHRPLEPVQRSRPIARSPERGLLGTSQGRRTTATRQALDREETYAPRYESDGHRRTAPPPASSSYRYHHDELDYDRRRRYEGPLTRGGPLESDHEPLIDYAMEDDLDWAAGRWESRDMARLAAAVARQGRRWDAIRERIRVPVLVSPYDDDDEVYDGVRFEPFPYYRSEPRRISQSSMSGGITNTPALEVILMATTSTTPTAVDSTVNPLIITSTAPLPLGTKEQQEDPLYAPLRQSRTAISGPIKRTMPPRAIPEVVDVDLTTDALSGDEGVIERSDMDRESEMISIDDPEQQQPLRDQKESELAPTTITTEGQEESTNMSVDVDETFENGPVVVVEAAGDQEPRLVNEAPEPMDEEEQGGEPTTAAAAGIASAEQMPLQQAGDDEGAESMPSIATE